MSRGGPTPKAAPVGWVRLEGRYTIRWRRGDPVAHVLGAQQMGDHGMAGVLDTIPVSPSGWTDLAEIRLVGRAASPVPTAASPTAATNPT